MDPALAELLRGEEAAGDRVVEAIIRLHRPGPVPEVRLVARFGLIATCRLPLGAIASVREHPNVASLKAPRGLGPEPENPAAGSAPDSPAARQLPAPLPADRRRPAGLELTGAGVVVGAVDWGMDVAHPDFRAADGSTRLLALWDQRDGSDEPPDPYGYGVVHTRERIDQALGSGRPYDELGYHPAISDRGNGSHGTHVLDIAAGNGRAGGPCGVAPESDLVFVHMADRNTGGEATLGDSVRLLEAVDFIARVAGTRPWVLNLSVGRCGGQHDGTTLVELALDELLAAAPGRFIVQSTGNYYRARTHASGTLRPGERRVLTFDVAPKDLTPNELEIWYPGDDELAVRVDPPGARGPVVPLGDQSDLVVTGRPAGRVYHRAQDPNNGDNHVDAFLLPHAGRWRVTLEARRIHSGRFHAWLERDDVCPPCQARFVTADTACTTGTIANGHLPLVVGAYDAHSPDRPAAVFSSAGPTRDGRGKPDLAAPGVRVLAARSTRAGAQDGAGELVRKSGTSMATPHVTGAIALCLQADPGLTVREIRALVLDTARPARDDATRRFGRGYLDIPRLVAAARARRPAPDTKDADMDAEFAAMPLALAPARAYRELLYQPAGPVAGLLDRIFEVLGRPGQRLADAPRPGDVVLTVTLGRRGGGRCAVVAVPELTRRRTSCEHGSAGWYVTTNSPLGDGALQVLDGARVVLPGRLLLRRKADPVDETPVEFENDDEYPDEAAPLDLDEEEEPADPGPWAGTPEQEDFRARVLAEHIARTTAVRGAPQRDLRADELADIPSTSRTERGKTTAVRTATATAQAAELLLTAANSALRAAQQAGDADALRTVRLTAVSGYRGSDHQRQLWLGYFATKYYNKTREARARIADGPHSDAAVDYMLRPTGSGGYGVGGRIAAPGFSNHQGGIAIDLWQERTSGNAVGNDSDNPSRCRWRLTWFHGWLRTNAAAHGFQPIATEEWHWEYRPNVHATSDLADHRGGKLWTFTSATHPHPVAVFCPKAALGRADVDVLVFAHGLLGGCPRPQRVPAGFVTTAPFELGRVVDESGRPLVLVVPLLDWVNPCGAVVFGARHKDWQPLGKPAALNAVVSEVLAEVGRVQGAAAPALRQFVVAGHSRAYDVLEPLAANRTDVAMTQGALARLSEVWAFDTTYAGDVGAWTDWLRLNQSLRLRVYYRPVEKTKNVGDRFYAQRGDRLAVTRVEEKHCAVPAQRLAELLTPTTPAPSSDEAALDEDLSAMHGLGDELLFETEDQ